MCSAIATIRPVRTARRKPAAPAEPESRCGCSARTRVLRWIEDAIASGDIRRGEAVPSSRELARELGVARNTAAAALEEAETRGVLVRRSPAARKRFVPDAAATASVASATIYVMGELAPDGDPAPRWSDRFLSVQAFSRLSATGRHVMLLNSDALSAAAVDDLFRAPPAAMLILSTVAGNPYAMRALERCRAAGVPVVVHGNAPDLRGFDRVYTDHRATGRDLTRWLLAHGRRRIVPFFPYMPETYWAAERLAGYADAMREAGLKPLPCTIFGTALPDDTPPEERFRVRKALAVSKLLELGCGRAELRLGRDPECGKAELRLGRDPERGRAELRLGRDPECGRAELRLGRNPGRGKAELRLGRHGPDKAGPSLGRGVDALLCLSDNWARVAIAAMRDLGLAPHRDILVAGHDNIDPGAEFGVFEADEPDATIDKHNETKAAALASLLAARLAGDLPPEPQCRIHSFTLLERESSR